MADEKVFLKVGDLISARRTQLVVDHKAIYDTARDALELIGVDPNMPESELRKRLGTDDY